MVLRGYIRQGLRIDFVSDDLDNSQEGCWLSSLEWVKQRIGGPSLLAQW